MWFWIVGSFVLNGLWSAVFPRDTDATMLLQLGIILLYLLFLAVLPWRTTAL